MHLPGKTFAVSRPMIQTKTVETLAHTIHRFSASYKRIVFFGRDNPIDVWRLWEMVRFYSKIGVLCPHLAFEAFLLPVFRDSSILKNQIGVNLLSLVAEEERFNTDTFLRLFQHIENTHQFTEKIMNGDCIICQYSSDAAAASVIALENDPAYLDRGISSCMPDEETLGYLMAHAIIGDFSVARDANGFISCTGKFTKCTTTP